MTDDLKPKLGGTPEQQAEFLRRRQEKREEDAQRWEAIHRRNIERFRAAGWPTDNIERMIRDGIPPGDHPDPLTEEDEEILDRVWGEPLRPREDPEAAYANKDR